MAFAGEFPPGLENDTFSGAEGNDTLISGDGEVLGPPYLILGELEIPLIMSPKDMSFTENWQYTKHDRIGGQGNLQYLGKDNLDLTINFRWFLGTVGAQYDPSMEIRAMREVFDAAREAGEWLTLEWGDRTFAGDFIIKSWNSDGFITGDDGRIIAINIGLTLMGIDPEAPPEETGTGEETDGFVYSDSGDDLL